jgi:hypothetical protein
MIKSITDSIIGIFGVLIKPNLPRTMVVVALVIGTLVGLVWGYAIHPTVYYDGDPASLQQTWQNEWVKLLADRYIAPTNRDLSANIIDLLSRVDNPLGIVDSLLADPGEIDNFGKLQAIRPLAEQAQPFAAEAPNPDDFWATIRPFLLAPLALAIAAVLFVVVYNVLIKPAMIDPVVKRMRGGGKVNKEVQAIRQAQEQERKILETQRTDFAATTSYGTPLLQRITSYPSVSGGEFDESYEIEEGENFLGQCGAVYSDALDLPGTQLMAIEVWLFDTNDFVRTMTKVFVSEAVMNNPAQRDLLAQKGDLVLAQPGAVMVMETRTLRLQARIVTMQYAAGAAPNSIFERLSIELAAWRKPEGSGQPVMVQPPVQQQFAPPPLPPQQAMFTPPPAQPTTMPGAPSVLPPMSPPAAPQPQRRPPDDDPFGGTGDFSPIG